jgi:hypothetical protein
MTARINELWLATDGRLRRLLLCEPSRRTRIVLLLITGLFVALGAELLIVGMIQLGIGLDYRIYLDRSADFVAGRGFYLDRQLHGPYDLELGDSLYPPPAVLLFVPFLWLPSILWWAIPLGIIAAVVIYQRPSIWVWPFLAFCAIAGNGFASTIQKGNPLMWVGAALALATVYRPFAVVGLLKWTVLPLVLFGANRRSWWIALGIVAIVSLAFLPMWSDYIAAITGAEGRGWGYPASEIPFVIIPFIAWLGSTRRLRATQLKPAANPALVQPRSAPSPT